MKESISTEQLLTWKRAKDYGIKCHRETNHKYDGDKPYEHHLQMVEDAAFKFIDLIPIEQFQDAIGACWCHDVIEDCRQTYNDVKKATNEQIVEIVYACTNEKGKNRAERANDKYYAGIKANHLATFVKLCDRIANIEYSKQTGSRMLDMYRKENDDFQDKMWSYTYQPMLDYMKAILRKEKIFTSVVIEQNLKDVYIGGLNNEIPVHMNFTKDIAGIAKVYREGDRIMADIKITSDLLLKVNSYKHMYPAISGIKNKDGSLRMTGVSLCSSPNADPNIKPLE